MEMQLFIFARTNKNPPALCWIPLVSWQLQNRSCRRQVWYTIDDIFFFHRRKLCKIFAFKYFIWFLMCTVGPRKQLYRYQSSHLYFFFFFARAILQIFYSPVLERIPTNSWNLLKYRAECSRWYAVHWLSLLKRLCIFLLDTRKKFDILLG